MKKGTNIKELQAGAFKKLFEELLGKKKTKNARKAFETSFNMIKNNTEIDNTQKKEKIINKITEIMKTKKVKGMNTRAKATLALIFCFAVGTYADIAYNDAAISNKLVQMFKSDDKADDQNNVPQKTIKPTQQELLNQNTKKQTDPTPTPTEGDGGEPDDDAKPTNGSLGGNTPEPIEPKDNPAPKDSIPKTTKGKKTVAKDKTNEGTSLEDELDLDLDEIDEEIKASQEEEKKLDNENAKKRTENAALDNTIAQQEVIKAKNEQIIAELKGKKGDKQSKTITREEAKRSKRMADGGK